MLLKIYDPCGGTGKRSSLYMLKYVFTLLSTSQMAYELCLWKNMWIFFHIHQREDEFRHSPSKIMHVLSSLPVVLRVSCASIPPKKGKCLIGFPKSSELIG